MTGWRVAGLLLAAIAGGCAVVDGGPGRAIEPSHRAAAQDSRVQFLILHYTVADFPTSMKILTEQDVSAHYLLSDEEAPRVYRLVEEYRRAWHSGASAWKGSARLNSSSIGIEIVHPGYKRGSADGPPQDRVYQPFETSQIDALIPLIRDIVQRHHIPPENILAHGEVTPSYKEDPGPTFPWKQLADLGITSPWPDPARVAAARQCFELALPGPLWFQQALAQHGYNVQATGAMDVQTQRVMMNFQMRYRPANYKGQLDAESAAILFVLTQPAPAR